MLGQGGVHAVLQVDWVPVNPTFQAHLPLVTTEASNCPDLGRAHGDTALTWPLWVLPPDGVQGH